MKYTKSCGAKFKTPSILKNDNLYIYTFFYNILQLCLLEHMCTLCDITFERLFPPDPQFITINIDNQSHLILN